MKPLLLLIFLTFFFGCSQSTPDKKMIKKLLRITIWSGTFSGDKHYWIGKDKNSKLVSQRINENLKYDNYKDHFKNIEEHFSEEVLDKIRKKLAIAYPICLKKATFNNKHLYRLDPKRSIFGYVKENILFSPDKKYALVKSQFGGLFLLNVSSLDFDNVCLLTGLSTAWNKNNVFAISYNQTALNEEPYILIYDVKNKKKRILEYPGIRIEDISWLINSQTLAITSSESLGNNPLLFLGAMIHTDFTYNDFNIDFYDYKTRRNQSLLIEKGLFGGYSVISGFPPSKEKVHNPREASDA